MRDRKEEREKLGTEGEGHIHTLTESCGGSSGLNIPDALGGGK